MIPLIIILSLIVLVIGLIVGFLELEFIDMKLNVLEDWCNNKKKEDDTRNISRFSFKRFVGMSSSIVVKIFERIDKIENARLKIGIKIDSLIILFSIILAIIYLLILFIVTIIDFIPLYILILLLLFSFGPLLGFVKTEFADSINSRVENWCINKNSEYKTKDINRFSRDGIVKLFSFAVIKIFKHSDRIQDTRLKAGIKIDSLILVISITTSLIILLIAAAITLLIAVVYLVSFLIGLYILSKLFELWDRHERGLPLFPDKDTEYYEVKTSFWDKVAGKDKKTIRDSKGDKVGDISTGFWDNVAGNDKKTIRDSKGDKVGDIKQSPRDNDVQIVRMKKSED